MLNEDYPNCPACGRLAWNGYGAAMGPGGQFCARTCECGQILHYAGRGGWWLVFIAPPELEQSIVDYINGPMTIQARAYQAEWEKASDAKEKVEYDALVASWGLDPAAGCIYTPRKTVDEKTGEQTGWVMEEITETGRDGTPYKTDRIVYDYCTHTGDRIPWNVLEVEAFRKASRALWDANPRHPSIVRAPDPVQVPEGVTVFVSRKEWEKADPNPNGVLPADPLRISWEKYFDEVFAAVKTATGADFSPVEIPNEYNRDQTNKAEPWFRLDIPGLTLKVGPRHRVINIDFDFARPANLRALKRLSTKHNTTYQASKTTGYIHAWHQERCVEYIVAAIKAVKA